MTLEEACAFENHVVKVICIDGQEIEGLLWPCIPKRDSNIEKDEIEIFTGNAGVLIPLDEVLRIETMIRLPQPTPTASKTSDRPETQNQPSGHTKSEELLTEQEKEFILTHLKNGEEVIKMTDRTQICDELNFYTLECFNDNWEIDENGRIAEAIIDRLVYGDN